MRIPYVSFPSRAIEQLMKSRKRSIRTETLAAPELQGHLSTPISLIGEEVLDDDDDDDDDDRGLLSEGGQPHFIGDAVDGLEAAPTATLVAVGVPATTGI